MSRIVRRRPTPAPPHSTRDRQRTPKELGQAAALRPSDGPAIARTQARLVSTGSTQVPEMCDNGEGVSFGDSCPKGCCMIAEAADTPRTRTGTRGGWSPTLRFGDASRKPPRLVANPAAADAVVAKPNHYPLSRPSGRVFVFLLRYNCPILNILNLIPDFLLLMPIAYVERNRT